MGNNHLGGTDFDNRLLARILDEVKKETGTDLTQDLVLLQMMRDWDMFSAAGGQPAEFQAIQLRGFTTTVKKHDLEFGIPSLAADFEMGRWRVPEHEETLEWYTEMERWSPDAHTGDRLMASWFCREGLRTPIPNIRLV